MLISSEQNDFVRSHSPPEVIEEGEHIVMHSGVIHQMIISCKVRTTVLKHTKSSVSLFKFLYFSFPLHIHIELNLLSL